MEREEGWGGGVRQGAREVGRDPRGQGAQRTRGQEEGTERKGRRTWYDSMAMHSSKGWDQGG